MNKLDKNMEEIFNVAPRQTVIPAPKSPVVEINNNLDEDLHSDYDTVRRNYVDIIDSGKDAINDLMKIASESEHPRAYEVIGTLIRSVTEANEKLILLQKQMRDMSNQKPSNSPGVNVEQAIFVGSTSDLLKTIKQHRAE